MHFMRTPKFDTIPDMDSKRSIIVLENTAVKAAREIVHGVMRYASTRPEWKLEVLTGHPSELEEAVRIGRPDGIVSGFTDEPTNPIPVSIRRSTPTVFTCTIPFKGMTTPWALLEMDDGKIAETAAGLLLRKNLKSYGFFGLRHATPWSAKRLQRFRKTIRSNGFAISEFQISSSQPVSIETEYADVVNWLTSLEKPCGIFAVTDQRAKLLLNICQKAGINAPEQIKVVGVDNDEIVCECAKPTLSSIAPDFHHAGFAAAQALDHLMQGRHTARKITIGTLNTVERMSTSDISGSGNRIGLALETIRKQAFNGSLTVYGLARTVGCSTRLLEKDFKRTIGRSIIKELNRIRLEKVQELLQTTSMEESSIAATAGFGSAAYLRNLFRKRFGMTMRQWRITTSGFGSAMDLQVQEVQRSDPNGGVVVVE